MTAPNDILDFWFPADTRPGPSQPRGRDNPAWFQTDPDFDQAIRDRFLDAWQTAADGGLREWTRTPDGALALVILLDQFPRNMFRGDARAFSTDAAAMEVAEQAIGSGFDRMVDPMMRKFFYLPFEHDEDPGSQARAVDLISALDEPEVLEFAERHRRIIDRFGRFPHRNALLGRPSTPEEEEWLAGGGDTFGTSVSR